MDLQLLVIFCLTFVIHLIGTLAYSVRIAGTRTGRIALSLSLFNILVLISRTSNAFQAPILTNRVETNIIRDISPGAGDFRWLLGAAALATVVGAVLTPTFQRIFTGAVARIHRRRTIPALLLHALSGAGLSYIRSAVTMPQVSMHLKSMRRADPALVRAAVFNTIAVAIWTVGVFAPLYAGYLVPELRATANSLSAVVNGVATILLFVLIDPYLSMVTDEVVEGRATEAELRRSVGWMVGSRLVGTLTAQLILVPAALLTVGVAQWL